MTRAETVDRVRDLCGPLGPCRSLADQTEQTDRWLASSGAAALEALLELIREPATADERRGVTAEEFSDVVGELLGLAAQLRPAESVPLLARQLADDRVAPFAADALAATQSVDAQRALVAHLATVPDLAENRARALVDAVVEIGGPQVAEFLNAVRKSRGNSVAADAVRHRLDVLLKPSADRS